MSQKPILCLGSSTEHVTENLMLDELIPHLEFRSLTPLYAVELCAN